MQSNKEQFKSALNKSFGAMLGGSDSSELMKDVSKFSREMKEAEKLKGGKSDRKTLKDVANKFTKKTENIEEMIQKLKIQLKKGIKVEMEHTKDSSIAKEIAMDHLWEDPKYYDKLKKIESKEQVIRTKVKTDLKDKLVGSKKMDKPIGKLFYVNKSENNEATGSGSSGGYVGKVAFTDSDFVRNSFKETPKLQKEDVDKVEATEATTSGSVGGYLTPSVWAKSTRKKDWGPSRKTQYRGGSFVKVKKKCTKFPYCNQGDINALKLTKNESVNDAIKNVSVKYDISEQIIKNILEYELSKLNKK